MRGWGYSLRYVHLQQFTNRYQKSKSSHEPYLMILTSENYELFEFLNSDPFTFQVHQMTPYVIKYALE